MEGYLIYHALVIVFDREKFRTLVYYAVGYGGPALLVVVLVLVNELTGVEMYPRRDDEGLPESCFLSVEAMPAIAVPAGVMMTVS